jgi:hypothetical protein
VTRPIATARFVERNVLPDPPTEEKEMILPGRVSRDVRMTSSSRVTLDLSFCPDGMGPPNHSC